jgi:hypothetical protein
MKTKHIFLLLLLALGACNKNDFLDSKPKTSIIIPTSLEELRSMLDNTSVFTNSPSLGLLGCDDYYLSTATWQSLTEIEHNSYSWEKDIYGANRNSDEWSIPWQQVLFANIVLEQLDKLAPTAQQQNEWNNIKGSALFLRAYAFNSLLQIFAQAYDPATAATDPGIPLKLDADIHHLLKRSSLANCYNQLIADLVLAAPLLSPQVPTTAKNRPSRPAVYALLSRVFTDTRQYDKAGKYADSCLQGYSTITDYNTLNAAARIPFSRSNEETIYYSQAIVGQLTLTASATTTFIDTSLYRSFASNDLRKIIFFRTLSGGNIGINWGYGGTNFPFTGLTTDEVLLERAESLARAGSTAAAMSDLNTLLAKRWKTGTYTPMTATSPADALAKILVERRKELIWRGTRWMDLKRLNKEGAGITLTRVLNGQTYTLPPNSPRYVLSIPDAEIANSGIEQNQR